MVKKIGSIVLMGIMSALVVLFAITYQNDKRDKAKESGEELNVPLASDGVITLWYSDEAYTEYFKEVAAMYEEDNDIKVDVQFVSSIDYVKSIYEAIKQGNKAPDIYLIRGEYVEQAYASGIAEENAYKDIFNETNYALTALNALTYHDKLVGYPLSYDTPLLLYNKAYAPEAPTTIEQIKDFSNNFDASTGSTIKSIFQWDVNDLLFNYGMIGKYINVCGETGDDVSKIEVNNENAIKCATYYQALYPFFDIDPAKLSYKDIMTDFSQGKSIYTFTTIEGLIAMQNSEVDFGVVGYPNLTDELLSRPLSITNAIMINPFAGDKQLVKEFAKFLTYTDANEVYEHSGYPSARRLDEMSEIEKTAYTQYEKAISLPKLMITSDFWLRIQNALASVGAGEDAKKIIDGLQTYMISQVK